MIAYSGCNSQECYENVNKIEKTLEAKSSTISSEIEKLNGKIELLCQELSNQVSTNNGDLIRQASHAYNLENALNIISFHMNSLFAKADAIKAQITGPYTVLVNQTIILKKLNTASHTLRQISRFQQLNKRLSITNDVVQKASLLQDLDKLLSDPDLNNLDIMNSALRNIRAQQQKIVRLANIYLTQGITNENIVQSTTALQIFFNLGTINTALKNVVDVCLHECRESLKTSFSVSSNMGNVSKSSSGPGKLAFISSQNFRDKVWDDLEKVFGEEIFHQCNQVKFLQLSLESVKNIQYPKNIAELFWKLFFTALSEEINYSSPIVVQLFEIDYPKLLKLLLEMIRKLNYKYFTFKRKKLESIENSYISCSFNRIIEPMQLLFNEEDNIPAEHQIDSIIRVISNELKMVLIEEILIQKVMKNISKFLRMFCLKVEQHIQVSDDAAQVLAGVPNSFQQKNIKLANALFYLRSQMERVLENMKDILPQVSIIEIEENLKMVNGLTSAILQPLTDSIIATVEKITITIHQEPDWSKLTNSSFKSSISISLYMRELTEFLERVYFTYLMPFENKEVLTNKCSEIAVRCMELLVLHASLLRPILPERRCRLQTDFNYLENTLKIFCPFIPDLGKPYRIFKSVESLVTLPPNEILSTQVSGSSVPHSIVLFLLFSYAEPEFTSPHQNMQWSIDDFIIWLDKHKSEADRLDIVAGALQRYEKVIFKKKSTNFDSVYPIMSQLLSIAMKT